MVFKGNINSWCGKKKLSLSSPDSSTPGRQRKVSVFNSNTITSESSSSTSPKSLLETEPVQGSQEARQFSEK